MGKRGSPFLILYYTFEVLKGSLPLRTDKKAVEIQVHIILQKRGRGPYGSRVAIMASHLTVSKAFRRSMERQHLLQVFFLLNPYIISSAKIVLSEIFLP